MVQQVEALVTQIWWPEFDPRIQVTREGQNRLHKVVL